jgi:ubiquinone/menaquinone biosynthesis C-methylase UbiE
MERIQDTFLSELAKRISFEQKRVLEIWCGNGSRTSWFASLCKEVYAIDPDVSLIQKANERMIRNAYFSLWNAEKVNFKNGYFDIVIFSLSFHHIPHTEMKHSIDEAIRVLKSNGYIIFFEPTEEGSFFESEILFDACDGDERRAKHNAFQSIHSHEWIQIVDEYSDEVWFLFSSNQDFIESLSPKKNLENIGEFLEQNSYFLKAQRMISIYQCV